MKKPLVYIVILNWNGYEDTIECLMSLRKIEYPNYKIVLIDNASTNESVSILQSKFPDIPLIANKENLGFSGGCNVGIRYALDHAADYVLLLNNDTIVDANFLSALVSVGEKDGHIGALSPFIYLADKPQTIWSSGLDFKEKSAWPFYDTYKNKKDTGQCTKAHNVEFLTGCSMLIKREVLKKIGMYTDEYFLYIEDMDFSKRITDAGYTLYSIPQSKIWHKVGQSSKKKGEENVRYFFIRNLLLFFRYNYPMKKRIVYFYYFSRANGYLLLQNIRKRNMLYVKAIIMGVYHGLIGKTGYYSLTK